MQKILAELNATPGIIGSLVVTDDGMVVASALSPDLDQEVVAALTANMIRLTKRSMRSIGETSVKRYMLSASHGRMVFHDIGIAFLVVVTNQNIDVNHLLVEITSAGNKIVHRRA